ncbi:MAG: acyltransferase family protein [Muribaculaceae bacterium]|nr:acyltransferase family protein [Muribaculaceae bacterium]
MGQRDVQLDNYRALMIMHVLFIHVLYWLWDWEEPYMSLALFEMATVFFVSGASQAMSRSRRSLWLTVVGRLRRVVIPFYIYACVVIALFALLTVMLGDTSRFGFDPLHLGNYRWEDVLSVVLCRDVPQVPNNTHLWFIVPYLILSCTFPLQQWLIDRCPNRHLYMAACVALFLLVQAVTSNELLCEVLCYNVFMVAGYLYYKRCKVLTIVAVCMAAAAVLLVYTLMMGGDFCPLQSHKFPPDWVFLSYCVFALCLVSLVLRHVTIPSNRFLRLWSERGYTIYLYQSAVFVAVVILRLHTYGKIPDSHVWLACDTIAAILLSTLLSMATFPLEKSIMGLMRTKH